MWNEEIRIYHIPRVHNNFPISHIYIYKLFYQFSYQKLLLSLSQIINMDFWYVKWNILCWDFHLNKNYIYVKILVYWIYS